jgi:hypothetical protein
MIRTCLITLFVLFVNTALLAQQSPYYPLSHITDTFYFASGSAEISGSSKEKLRELKKYMFDDRPLYITTIYSTGLQGHSDNIGSKKSNKLLSQKRLEAVYAMLGERFFSGQHPVTYSEKCFGESRPVTSNRFRTGRQKNRCVIISLAYTKVLFETSPVWDTITIKELYEQTKLIPEKFCINNKRDTVLVAAHGTIIYIKKNSIVIPDGSPCNTSCLSVEVKEALFKSDIAAENLNTMSNGKVLVSQSMVSVEVKCNGEKMLLKPGADYVILAPTDNIVKSSGIYYGGRDRDDNFNWDSLSKEKIDSICGTRHDNYVALPPPKPCESCSYVFCGFGKWVGGWFSKENRKMSRQNKQCRKESRILLRNTRQAARAIKKDGEHQSDSTTAALVNLYVKKDSLNLSTDSCYRTGPCGDLHCIALSRAMKDSLISKEVMELSRRNMKQNGNPINLNDLDKLQYYVYAAGRPGWTNIDWMMKVQDDQLENITINLVPSKFTDCKLIFKNHRTVLTPQRNTNGQFEFKLIPKNEPAYLLMINTGTGKGYIETDLQSMITGKQTITPNFKPISIVQYVAQLKQLDK